MRVCLCVTYRYDVFDCQSPSDTLSCAVFSYGDLRTYIRHCCVLKCMTDRQTHSLLWLYRQLYLRSSRNGRTARVLHLGQQYPYSNCRLFTFSTVYCTKSTEVRSAILYTVTNTVFMCVATCCHQSWPSSEQSVHPGRYTSLYVARQSDTSLYLNILEINRLCVRTGMKS